jgi:hypothetical protein
VPVEETRRGGKLRTKYVTPVKMCKPHRVPDKVRAQR